MAENKKETTKKVVDKKNQKVDKEETPKTVSEIQAEKVVEEFLNAEDAESIGKEWTDEEPASDETSDETPIEPEPILELPKKELKQEDEATIKARKKAEQEIFLQKTAEILMRENNVKEIWRDNDSGYWFTTKEYAEAYAKKKGSPLKLTKYTL